MVILRDDTDSDKIAFFEIGLQYYLAGRASYFSSLMPVSGNLFHHSVEMMLKAALIVNYQPEELWNEYSHKLPKLWRDFKKLYPDEKQKEFDEFINVLNKWDELRYPIKTDSGVSMMFALEKGKQPRVQKMKGRKSRDYILILEEADEFLKYIIKPLSINLDYVKIYLRAGFEERLSNYIKSNKHNIFE